MYTNCSDASISLHMLEGKNGEMYYPRTRDYTTAAILILILYFLGWLPGFLFNLIKLLIAAFEMDSYDSVQGLGCLISLFIVCGIGPVALFGIAYFTLLHLY
jgi:uncharacterized membrane protein